MPPHCDAIDGPVIQAAKKAIAMVNLAPILPWVPEEAEDELRKAFELTMHVREKSPDARILADRFFLETAVRLHQAGEGTPFTGLKPAGIDLGPVIPMAEEALERGSRTDLTQFLEHALEFELEKRFSFAQKTAKFDPCDFPAARAHVQAKLRFLQFVNQLCSFFRSDREATRERHEHATLVQLGKPYEKRHPATVEALAHPRS